MRRKAGEHENFFIAKNRDSESAQRASGGHRRVVATPIKQCWLNAHVTKTPAAQSFPAILTIAGAVFPRASRTLARMHCSAADKRAPRVSIHARQYFLKLDAVFLDVLVYSGCSASRFPSARSD
jgi:hypothetical protein